MFDSGGVTPNRQDGAHDRHCPPVTDPSLVNFAVPELRAHPWACEQGVRGRHPSVRQVQRDRDGAFESLRVCLFLTKIHIRVIGPGFSQLMDGCPNDPNRPVATAMRQLDRSLDQLIAQAKLQAWKFDSFFGEGTYPTEGMRQVLRNIFGRLKGSDASYPAIQRLETALGGGKTHTLIAATHLAYRGTEIAEAARELLDPELLLDAGQTTVVGIASDRVAIHETKGSRLIPYTLWGEIAYQIGGEALYREIGTTATSFGSPGDQYFDLVLKGRRVLIMLDELAAYAARVEAARPGGRSSVATLLMSLFQYAKDHTGISVVLTLASQKDAFARQTAMLSQIVSQAKGEGVSKTEALDIARRADGEVRSVVVRDVTTVTPVRGQEISRVLARRLFGHIDQDAAARTADAYMEMYRRTATLLPEAARQET
jgi:predicted AAA+ superfamily ATPase